MTKNDNKTVPTTTSVDAFIGSLDDLQQQEDSRELVKIMSTVTGKSRCSGVRQSLVSGVFITNPSLAGKVIG